MDDPARSPGERCRREHQATIQVEDRHGRARDLAADARRQGDVSGGCDREAVWPVSHVDAPDPQRNAERRQRDVPLPPTRCEQEVTLLAHRDASDAGKAGQRGVVGAPLQVDDLDRIVRGVGDAEMVRIAANAGVVEPAERSVRRQHHGADGTQSHVSLQRRR